MVLLRHSFSHLLGQAVRQIGTGFTTNLTATIPVRVPAGVARLSSREPLLHRITSLLSTDTVSRWTRVTSGFLFLSRSLCVTPPAECPGKTHQLTNCKKSTFSTASMDSDAGMSSGQGSTDQPANTDNSQDMTDSTAKAAKNADSSNASETLSTTSTGEESDIDFQNQIKTDEAMSQTSSNVASAINAEPTEPGNANIHTGSGIGHDSPVAVSVQHQDTSDLKKSDRTKNAPQSSSDATISQTKEPPGGGHIREDDPSEKLEPQNMDTAQSTNPNEQNTNPFEDNTNPFEENTNPFEENTNPFEENTNPFEQNTNPFESDPDAMPSACPFSDSSVGGKTDPNDKVNTIKQSDDKGAKNQTRDASTSELRSLPTTNSEIGSSEQSHGNRTSVSVTSSSQEVSNEAVDTDGDVVLVTGGNGFLGQHVVKMLQTRAPHVAEIRVLDLKPFQQKLEYPANKTVTSLVGDIADEKFVAGALKGVNSVIHVAGLISWGTFPDFEGMERVNVRGTLNIFNSCIKNNVQRLIYCSTVDVVVGHEPIRGGTEKDTFVPDKFLFPGYPDTKYHGERIVLGSVRERRKDGSKLQTVILRANVLYGELDTAYVTNALRQAKQSKGILHQIGDGTAMFQQAYVGNSAWAFVCADCAMRENPQLSEEIFYIPDHTPIQNMFNFMRPYLEAHGFTLSDGYMSYSLWHNAIAAAEFVVKGLAPLKKISLPTQSCTIAYINTDLYFIGTKAHKVLKFEPIYSPLEARKLSIKYYQSLDLEEEKRES